LYQRLADREGKRLRTTCGHASMVRAGAT
jgi:hypothetical protein